MSEQLIEVLAELGADGLMAIYVYLVLDYVSVWVMFGLCTWGCITAWKWFKENN